MDKRQVQQLIQFPQPMIRADEALHRRHKHHRIVRLHTSRLHNAKNKTPPPHARGFFNKPRGSGPRSRTGRRGDLRSAGCPTAWGVLKNLPIVIPAHAGIHFLFRPSQWTPAFAEATSSGIAHLSGFSTRPFAGVTSSSVGHVSGYSTGPRGQGHGASTKKLGGPPVRGSARRQSSPAPKPRERSPFHECPWCQLSAGS